MAKRHSIEDVLKMIMDGNSIDMEQLEEDYDDDVEDEDWTPTAVCTDEDRSEDDIQEESVDQTSANVEDPSTTQHTTKQSTTGKVKRKEYQWKKKKKRASRC